MKAEVKEVSPAAAPDADAPAAPDEAAAEESAAPVCRNCGAALAGEFCHECGERRPDKRDLSLRHFAGEAVQEFASLEHSKLLRTLGALLFRPGLLTREHFAGRRGRYLKPLNLFLAALAINYLAYSYAGPYTAREMLRTEARHRQESNQSSWYERQAARKKISTEEFVTRVSEKWQVYGGLAVVHIFNALLFALLLRVVLPRTGRYFVEHLVFAVHFVTFSLAAQLAAWPAYLVESWPQVARDFWVKTACTLAYAVYLFFAARMFYGGGVGRNVFRSLALVFGFTLISILAYLLTYAAALYAVTH